MYACYAFCSSSWLLPVIPLFDLNVPNCYKSCRADVEVNLVMVCNQSVLDISHNLWVGLAQQHTAVVGIDMVLVHLQYTLSVARCNVKAVSIL